MYRVYCIHCLIVDNVQNLYVPLSYVTSMLYLSSNLNYTGTVSPIGCSIYKNVYCIVFVYHTILNKI